MLTQSLSLLRVFVLVGFVVAGVACGDEPNPERPGKDGNGNVVIKPPYKIDPDLTDRENPKGQSFEFSLPLAKSKIFRGKDKTLSPDQELRTERKINVYVPAAYEDGTEAPILVTFDGPYWLDLVSNALDNLTISKNPKRKSRPPIPTSHSRRTRGAGR
jgi:hypothetical protein